MGFHFPARSPGTRGLFIEATTNFDWHLQSPRAGFPERAPRANGCPVLHEPESAETHSAHSGAHSAHSGAFDWLPVSARERGKWTTCCFTLARGADLSWRETRGLGKWGDTRGNQALEIKEKWPVTECCVCISHSEFVTSPKAGRYCKQASHLKGLLTRRGELNPTPPWRRLVRTFSCGWKLFCSIASWGCVMAWSPSPYISSVYVHM